MFDPDESTLVGVIVRAPGTGGTFLGLEGNAGMGGKETLERLFISHFLTYDRMLLNISNLEWRSLETVFGTVPGCFPCAL